MLEKRGGRCRTDGPIRVTSCPMQHTIAAIKAAWYRSLYWASSRRASYSVSCERFITACSKRWLVTDGERRNRRVTCLLHIISDVTRVHNAQGTTRLILRAFIVCAPAVQTAVRVLYGLSCLGHYRPLQRRYASDKGLVRWQGDKIYRNVWSKPIFRLRTFLPFLKYYP